jgi:hypothetical protein
VSLCCGAVGRWLLRGAAVGLPLSSLWFAESRSPRSGGPDAAARYGSRDVGALAAVAPARCDSRAPASSERGSLSGGEGPLDGASLGAKESDAGKRDGLVSATLPGADADEATAGLQPLSGRCAKGGESQIPRQLGKGPGATARLAVRMPSAADAASADTSPMSGDTVSQSYSDLGAVPQDARTLAFSLHAHNYELEGTRTEAVRGHQQRGPVCTGAAAVELTSRVAVLWTNSAEARSQRSP